MTVFISVPMYGRDDSEIQTDIQVATDAIKRIFSEEEDLCIDHTNINWGPCDAGRLWYLGQAIMLLDAVDVVYFCPGWENEKECQIEHHICELYGIQRIEAE